MDDTMIKEALSYDLGSDLHEAWREPRKYREGEYDPRFKMTDDKEWIEAHGAYEVDIANSSFFELPSDWQRKNLEAARVVINLVYDKIVAKEEITESDMEKMAFVVHDEWLKRNKRVYNPNNGDPKLALSYEQLSKEEQAKYIAQLKPAIKKVQDYLNGLINIDEICEKYGLSNSSKKI